MLSAALIFVSLVIAYIIVAGLMGATTYGIAFLKPTFAVRNLRLNGLFNLLLDLAWLLFSAIGGYVVAKGAAEASSGVASALLALILLAVVWHNLAEARIRGMFHMLLTSLFIIGGVAAGYLVHAYIVLNAAPPQ